MTHEIIKIDNYLLVVDDSEIKEGDFYLRYNNLVLRCTQLKESFNEGLNKNEIIILSNGCGDPYERSRDYLKKIIAHLPLNNSPILEGVLLLPPLEQEDDVEKLAEKEYREFPNNPLANPEWHYNKDINCGKKRKAFVKGYNKAKEKYRFTEEDMIKFVDFIDSKPMRNYSGEWKRITNDPNDEPKNFATLTDKQLIEWFVKSLLQPKMPVAFDCEMVDSFTKNNDEYIDELGVKGNYSTHSKIIKTTTNSQGQKVCAGKYIYE